MQCACSDPGALRAVRRIPAGHFDGAVLQTKTSSRLRQDRQPSGAGLRDPRKFVGRTNRTPRDEQPGISEPRTNLGVRIEVGEQFGEIGPVGRTEVSSQAGRNHAVPIIAQPTHAQVGAGYGSAAVIVGVLAPRRPAEHEDPTPRIEAEHNAKSGHTRADYDIVEIHSRLLE